ncbi:MAG TPA: BTAD domain-containing putative transcriptional regulator [Streptosporangiaceae bacterium]|jgi:DNA-binding SARP family transcriptional activator
MKSAVEFRVLGPLEVIKDGSPVSITAPRQRTLLTVLALEANHVITVDRLVDSIWDELPPHTARSQVQICISSLRKILGGDNTGDIILTRASGYQLCADARMVDAIQFSQVLAQARAAAQAGQLEDSVRHFRAALDLWRGPAAADIGSGVVQQAATRLTEQRLAAAEECIRIELQLGRQLEVIAELAALVAENPLREKLRAYQMIALYRAGRQAEALDSYRAARKVFINELGIEPGTELRDLEKAILSNDTRLDAATGMTDAAPQPARQRAAAIPRQLPADVMDFTGREELSERVMTFLTLPSGSGDLVRAMRVVVLTGMSGSGKTALAVHLAHAMGGSFPDGQLFVPMRGDDTQPMSPRRLLERCLRAMGLSPNAMPSRQEELAAAYRSLLAARRVLVILDDADLVAQVTSLLPGSDTCAVIVTSRHRLSGLIGAQFFDVGPLSASSATELLWRVLGKVRPATVLGEVTKLAQLCGYLPLALRIVCARLLERPHWSVRQMIRRLENERTRLAELQIDGLNVTAGISISYESLSANARRLLLRLTLLGAVHFGSWVAAPLLDLDIEQSSDLLDELVVGRLVEVRQHAGESRLYLHDLVRVFATERLAADQLAAERAAALGRLLGCWLALAREARRRESGGQFPPAPCPAPCAPLPEQAVADLLARPLDWFRSEREALMSAIVQAAQAGLDELCWQLAVTAVTLFRADSLADDWQYSHEVALAAVRRGGNVRGEAAIAGSLAELAMLRRRLVPAAAAQDPASI